MNPILALMVGVSGSGKSTYANGLKTSINATIVEPDAIRLELTGNASDQSQNDKVFSLAFKRSSDLLAQGKNVVVDATSVDKWSRSKWIDLGKKNNAEIRAYVIKTPLELAKKRNLGRDRVVPDNVIDKQNSRLQMPTQDEGFDKIVIV